MACLGGGQDALQIMRLGFEDVLPPKHSKYITAAELATFIEGETTVNVQRLKEVVQYSEPYHANHPVVRLFWQLVEHHMDEEQRRKLLLFWTGSSTPSVTGFRDDPFDRSEDVRANNRCLRTLCLLLLQLTFVHIVRVVRVVRVVCVLHSRSGFGRGTTTRRTRTCCPRRAPATESSRCRRTARLPRCGTRSSQR